jgi:hypothetical protein
LKLRVPDNWGVRRATLKVAIVFGIAKFSASDCLQPPNI